MDFMNRTKYGVVVTENVQATQWGGHIYSLVDDAKDVENGWFGHVGAKVDREISEFLTPTTASIGTKKAVLAAAPAEIFYAPTPEGLQEFYFINKQGKPFRAYDLAENDEFSITEYTIDTLGDAAVKGNFVVLQDGSNRLKEVATAPSDHAFYGEIIDLDSSPLRPYMMVLGQRPAKFIGIRVVKNSV